MPPPFEPGPHFRFARMERESPEELRRRAELSPHEARHWSRLALALSRPGRRREAEAAARAAVRLDPELAFAHEVLAIVLWGRWRYDAAIGAITEAIRLDPADGRYHEILALLHYHRPWVRGWYFDQFRDALRAADDGLAVAPTHPGCWRLRAMALSRLGRFDEATRAFERALDFAPDSAEVHAGFAAHLVVCGDWERAESHLDEAARLEPGRLAELRRGGYRLSRTFLIGLFRIARAACLIRITPTEAAGKADQPTVRPNWWAGLWLAGLMVAAMARLGRELGDAELAWVGLGGAAIAGVLLLVARIWRGRGRWLPLSLAGLAGLIWVQLTVMILAAPGPATEVTKRVWPTVHPSPGLQALRGLGVVAAGLMLIFLAFGLIGDWIGRVLPTKQQLGRHVPAEQERR